jgi:hypothetical protein
MEEISKAQGRVFSLVEPAPSKEGRGKNFYTIPKNLAVGNFPIQTGTSDF